jgi:hypothetical protein
VLVPGGGRKDLDDLFQQFTESALLFLGLVVLVGIGLWVVTRVRSRLADDEGSATGDHRLLSQIADLKEQGDLTEEEYRSIKGRLVERIDDSMSAPHGKATKAVSPSAKSSDSHPGETSRTFSNPRDEGNG